jgi:uncharacterized protein DUF2785
MNLCRFSLCEAMCDSLVLGEASSLTTAALAFPDRHFIVAPLMTSKCVPRCLILAALLAVAGSACSAAQAHDSAFWKSIAEHEFAVPEGESVGRLSLDIADLASSTDPTLRDACGYETLATWIYNDHRLVPDELEGLRKKLLPGMFFKIGETDNDTIFRRSFSALYMSVLAAEDLKKPFLSASGFQETLDAALRCYGEEKDLRGYVPEKGWAHAAAHVADLLKFLARNEKLSVAMQKRIVTGVAQRARTAGEVFRWGEDSRMAATLLSLTNRTDFDPTAFDEWFKALVPENRTLWKSPTIDSKAYASVRNQANILAHLSAKIAAAKETHASAAFRASLNETLLQVD